MGYSFFAYQQYDQKNIRRRVYDALNVLMAMGIITKERKEIRWQGLPTNTAQECQTLRQEIKRRQDRIRIKKSRLQELLFQVRPVVKGFIYFSFLTVQFSLVITFVIIYLLFWIYTFIAATSTVLNQGMSRCKSVVREESIAIFQFTFAPKLKVKGYIMRNWMEYPYWLLGVPQKNITAKKMHVLDC